MTTTRWMMIALALALALAACSKARDRSDDPKPGGPTPVIDPDMIPPEPPPGTPADTHEPPARRGVAGSAVRSAPRRDWPCRFVQAVSEGTTIATTWEYGTRKECWIPVDLAGSRGLVGCPERQVQKNLENGVEMAETYEYDAAGHLHGVKTIAADFTYLWAGDLLYGRSIRGGLRPFQSEDGVAVIEDQNGELERTILDDKGRIIRYERGGEQYAGYRWKGTRLVEIAAIGTTRIEYSCKKPPRR
jgi:hypothetical protein